MNCCDDTDDTLCQHDCDCNGRLDTTRWDVERKALIRRYAERLWAIRPDDLYAILGDMLYEYEGVVGLRSSG